MSNVEAQTATVYWSENLTQLNGIFTSKQKDDIIKIAKVDSILRDITDIGTQSIMLIVDEEAQIIYSQSKGPTEDDSRKNQVPNFPLTAVEIYRILMIRGMSVENFFSQVDYLTFPLSPSIGEILSSNLDQESVNFIPDVRRNYERVVEWFITTAHANAKQGDLNDFDQRRTRINELIQAGQLSVDQKIIDAIERETVESGIQINLERARERGSMPDPLGPLEFYRRVQEISARTTKRPELTHVDSILIKSSLSLAIKKLRALVPPKTIPMSDKKIFEYNQALATIRACSSLVKVDYSSELTPILERFESKSKRKINRRKTW